MKTDAEAIEDRFAGHTPLMRQYLAMREEHPNVMLLYRLGDFYETFFDDALRINRLLGLTLTHRGTFQGKPIPMAGVPASTLDQYLARLVKLGESVAISEQIGDPAAARNGMMERKIVRIVTPGTITDNALLSEKRDSVLLAISVSKLKTAPLGLVWITLTNGNFRATRVKIDELASTLSRIGATEILTSEKGKDLLTTLGVTTTITELPDWHFDSERGEETLKHRFNLNNLAAWDLEHENELLAATNALIGYVAQTQCENLPYIRPLVIEREGEFIGIDAASRRNLEISETIRNDNGPTLFSVLDHSETSMGSRLMREWLNHPLQSAEKALFRQAAVKELVAKTDAATILREALSEIPDIERIAGRIALKSIRPKEVAALRDALPELEKLSEIIHSFTAPLFSEEAEKLNIEPTLYADLKRTILPEPATFLREGDVISSEVSPELAELRNLRDNAGDYLQQLEVREKERTGISTLRVEYNRVSGYYIEVPRGQVENVPVDYRRRQTLKNTERYITPELKDYEDKALSAKDRAQQIERRLWDELLDRLANYIEALQNASRAVATIDVIQSFATYAFQARWIAPQLTHTPGIDIKGGRHPVVEHMLEHYVPNDCEMNVKRRLLVITGPNMGGKSTYMRSVALIVLLAYTGSFVPATYARLGPIDKILTRIGASDDLARGRSTFMVEMTEAAAILHQATDSSLVLMDEIGRGTSTFDGLSLAGAIAEELAEKTKSWTLFATHYFELTELAQRISSVVNVHVSAEQTEKTVVFLHDVKDGAASQSYGIAVAKLAGISPAVIRRASNLLKALEEKAKNKDEPDLFTIEEKISDTTPVRSEKDIEREKFVEGIAEIDVDNLSPREALNILYQLKNDAKKTS